MQTATDRVNQYDALAGAGLHRLTQISLLLLISAAIALAAATGAAIWQRRSSFLDYRLQGYLPRQLWATLLIESGLILATGCAVGAACRPVRAPAAGALAASHDGLPGAVRAIVPAARLTFALVVAAALVAIAPWSYRAVKVFRDSPV